jgi:flagellar biosynthesis/type III secretory pathway protein FliH
VLPAAEAQRGVPLLGADPRRAHRIARQELEARLTAERILREARESAAALVAEARAQVGEVAAIVSREAREAAAAELTARWLALRQAEETARGRERDRVIATAVALAQRLLSASLALDPSGIAGLARAVFEETRGARRALIEANPIDAEELTRQLASGALGALEPTVVEVRGDEALARGELRLHTDVGTIDARLAPRFDRLAAALRDALG